MEYIQWAIDNWSTVIEGLLQIVGGASLLAKLTPTEKDNLFIDKVLALINGVAMNPKKDKAR